VLGTNPEIPKEAREKIREKYLYLFIESEDED